MDLVVGLVALNGGEVVGRTRLQKLAYLLEKCGLKSEFEFEYHNFGPFSAELARESDFARLAGRISAEEKHGFHEVPYTVFTTVEKPPEKLGALASDRARELLGVMKGYTAVDLEIAATLDWFRDAGDRGRVNREVQERKPIKAVPERLERGWKLLGELGLA
jgi:hypothetical protein